MSLFIKGMNMPEYRNIYGDGRATVNLCMLSVNKDGSAFLYCNDSNKEYCTVREISEPHGKLINADYLRQKLEKHRDMCGDIELSHGIDVAISILNNAPTIIEAEDDK